MGELRARRRAVTLGSGFHCGKHTMMADIGDSATEKGLALRRGTAARPVAWTAGTDRRRLKRDSPTARQPDSPTARQPDSPTARQPDSPTARHN